jgi:type II secretory pathway pseudopilin PulG
MINKNKSQKGFTPLENKRKQILSSLTGFTPLQIKQNAKKRKFVTGFTLVEIIVAGLIITLTTGGTFASYLYARQYSDKFRHRAMAQRGAQEIAEYIRYRLADGYRNETDLAVGTYTKSDVTDTHLSDILYLEDPSDPDLTYGIWDEMHRRVDNLIVSYTIEDVFFQLDPVTGNAVEQPTVAGTHNSRKFKKVIINVNYDNRRAI